MSRTIRKKAPPPVSLRLTEEERAKLQRAAIGVSISSYIRERLFGEHVGKRKVRGRAPVKDHQALGRVLGLLGKSRIANNLNQLARDANCGALILDEVTEKQIAEAYEHVLSMRSELIRALGLIEESGK